MCTFSGCRWEATHHTHTLSHTQPGSAQCLQADRYQHGKAASYSPYYKWRRCFWQSFSLQCPLHRHLYKINRARRRWAMKLIRSRGWRPDCNLKRQKAGREARSTMQPARSWGGLSVWTRLHPRTHIEHPSAGKRQCTRGQTKVAGSRLLATSRKRACCVRKHYSPAHQGKPPELIGPDLVELIDMIEEPHTDLHGRV